MDGGEQGRGRGQLGCLSPPDPPAPRSFGRGPGRLSHPSSAPSSFLLSSPSPLSSFPPPPPLYSLLLPEEPRPLPPLSSTTSTFQDERVQGTTGVVVLRTLALAWEK